MYNYESVYSASSTILEKLNNQKSRIKNNKKELLDYKNELKDYYNKVKEIEQDIKHKLSELSIDHIEPTSKEDKSLGDTDSLSYDVAKLELIYEKMKIYCREFEDNYLDLNDSFNELVTNYSTTNTKSLEEIQTSLLTNYKIIKNNFYNNLDLLKINIEKLTKVSNITKQVADSIEVSFDG